MAAPAVIRHSLAAPHITTCRHQHQCTRPYHVLESAQLRLIERLYAGATFITVSKLHGGFSGSLVLNVDTKTGGRANEPTVLKLDSAECTYEEASRTNKISELVGAEAIRALRGPMYVGADGED